MARLICLLLAAVFSSAAATAANVQSAAGNRAATARSPDSVQLEKDLQRLPWDKFRAIIESVPKLKADVERHGPTGWKFVEVNYQSYGWRKNIDKLDDAQKKLLVELLRQARNAK